MAIKKASKKPFGDIRPSKKSLERAEMLAKHGLTLESHTIKAPAASVLIKSRKGYKVPPIPEGMRIIDMTPLVPLNLYEAVEGEKLTLKQERFCVLYTQNSEFFGNSTLSYAEAYGFNLEELDKDNSEWLLLSGEIISGGELKFLKENDGDKKVKGAKKLKKSSYEEVYDACSVYGSRLRKNDKIQHYCRTKLNEIMRDDVVDARHMQILLRGKDEHSMQAIKEYNALKKRITSQSDVNIKGDAIGMWQDIIAKKK